MSEEITVTPDADAPAPRGDVELVACAPSSQRLAELARRVAASDCTVLIVGESGTGKEVLARFVHRSSTRASRPFIAVNCAAIPETMLEATLFGYERGAFTGALAAHAGKFEQAQGGTLLLDEVTEMPLGLQAKLLRVLQEREVERLGAQKPSGWASALAPCGTSSHACVKPAWTCPPPDSETIQAPDSRYRAPP
jgi:two-component system response regulator FlrC